jgi:hypothetical protein
MSLKQVHPLLIGELQAGICVNDDGCRYIALGPISDDAESAIGIDEIEARALHEWLGRVLRV